MSSAQGIAGVLGSTYGSNGSVSVVGGIIKVKRRRKPLISDGTDTNNKSIEQQKRISAGENSSFST